MVKYYVSWHPDPPDPRYWQWFDIDGIMVSPATLQGKALKRALTLGLHKYAGYPGTIFLDSGGFSAGSRFFRRTQIGVLNLQRWLRPDIIAHLDRPMPKMRRLSEAERRKLLKSTIENAKIAKRWSRRNDDIEIVYVIQGWDVQSIEKCARAIAKLKVGYVGLGSLIGQTTEEVVRRTRLVSRIFKKRCRIHLFGMSRIDALARVHHIIESFDSSTPIKAASFKEAFTPAKVRRNISSLSSFNCECPVCRRVKASVFLQGLRGNIRLQNRLRAIHNAYQIVDFVRKLD